MLDVISILMARERVRAGIEEPPRQRPPRRGRRVVAVRLRRLADRLEGAPRAPIADA
jgi:hypothetical protein